MYYKIAGIFIFLALIISSICSWYNLTFGVKIEELLFTLTSPLDGADISFMKSVFKYCIPTAVYVIGIVFLIALSKTSFFQNKLLKFRERFEKKKNANKFYKFSRILIMLCSFGCFFLSLKYVDDSLEISDYLKRKNSATTIYEDYYVDPASINITEKESKKNLIYIYLESMETTYASKKEGGAQETNYIPYLTEMAQENISFSNTEKLGGFHTCTGSGWTMAALLTTTSGVPYSIPVGGNDMDAHMTFAPGLTALGDILKQKGYYQEFVCGSNAWFAGRRMYFEEHGLDETFDYYTAIQEGYIDEDYYVFWGLEDAILYEIAKDELLKISSGNQPFNFTMLTVDTHHVEGYVCNLCEDKYPVQTANVVSCADKQIYNFIEWCKQQEFYEDTVIVITGDHPRMDTSLVENVESSKRTVYNCIINSGQEVEGSLTNREFTSLDIMPTTLAAMGFEFEGDRLGLGTNLFSDRKTLAEELGIEYLNNELGKYSEYYNEKFLK